MTGLALPDAGSRGPELPPGFCHLTVSSGIRAAASRTPAKSALTCDGRTRSFAQLRDAMNRVANSVVALGLQPGQNAALIAPNCLEYIEIVCGVSDIGAAVATPNPKLTPTELAAICNDAQARILFVHPDCESRVDRVLLETVDHVVVLGSAYDALMAQASTRFDPPPVPEWATFAIPYTSGTTGKPKGVMLSHRSRSLGFLGYAVEYGIYSPDDHFLAIAPMCHGAGLAYAMAALFVGGSAEIMARFEPEPVLRALHSGRVTGIFTVPTHHHAFFELEAPVLEGLRGHRLRGIVCNAAPLLQATKERILEYFGKGLLHETYGSTEAGVVSNLRPADQLRKTRCVGLPVFGNQVRLLDGDGQEVAIGEVGELHSLSPTLFNGYWRQESATRQAFRGGWVSVGDMARRDDEGFLYIVDRKQDMVITGGMNVYPREIECVFDSHPGVLESAIVGMPDAHWGEQLVAYVVPVGAVFDADALLSFARLQLAPFKIPKRIVVLQQLPRNANGKVLKTALRAIPAV